MKEKTSLDVHVIREQMRKQCRRQMNTKSTKEEQTTKNRKTKKQKKNKKTLSASCTQSPKEKINPHKNGIHRKFSTSAAKKFRWPSRYSNSVNPRFPTPGKTTVHARRISNECR